MADREPPGPRSCSSCASLPSSNSPMSLDASPGERTREHVLGAATSQPAHRRKVDKVVAGVSQVRSFWRRRQPELVVAATNLEIDVDQIWDFGDGGSPMGGPRARRRRDDGGSFRFSRRRREAAAVTGLRRDGRMGMKLIAFCSGQDGWCGCAFRWTRRRNT